MKKKNSLSLEGLSKVSFNNKEEVEILKNVVKA